MALFQTKPEPAKHSVTYDNEIASKIQQRRYQMLVHSLLYYELDTNLVSDAQWSRWAEELVKLQKQYPEISDNVIFADAFRTFDGSTGFDLPYRDEQVVNIAYRLLRSYANGKYSEAADSIRRLPTTPAQYEGFYSKSKQAANKPSQIKRKEVRKVESTKRKKLF